MPPGSCRRRSRTVPILSAPSNSKAPSNSEAPSKADNPTEVWTYEIKKSGHRPPVYEISLRRLPAKAKNDCNCRNCRIDVPKEVRLLTFNLEHMTDAGLAFAREVLQKHNVESVKFFEMGLVRATPHVLKDFITSLKDVTLSGGWDMSNDMIAWVLQSGNSYEGSVNAPIGALLAAKCGYLRLTSLPLAPEEMLQLLKAWINGELSSLMHWEFIFNRLEEILGDFKVVEGRLPARRPIVYKKHKKAGEDFDFYYIQRKDMKTLRLSCSGWITQMTICDEADLPEKLKKAIEQ